MFIIDVCVCAMIIQIAQEKLVLKRDEFLEISKMAVSPQFAHLQMSNQAVQFNNQYDSLMQQLTVSLVPSLSHYLV